MGLAHGKQRERQRQASVGVDVWRRQRGSDGQREVLWVDEGRESLHDAGIKSPIKLHGGILIYRLMLYCVTNHSQPQG